MVDNGSKKDLLLEPRFITLTDGGMFYRTPSGYAQVYSALPAGEDRQRVLEDLQFVTFDRPVTIAAGQSSEKLLLFSAHGEMGDRAVLTFTGLYSGQEPGGMILDFVRIVEER
jgi:hypothetical protein